MVEGVNLTSKFKVIPKCTQKKLSVRESSRKTQKGVIRMVAPY